MKLELRVGSSALVIESDGSVSITVRDDSTAPALPATTAPAPIGSDASLYERLVSLRRQLASDQGVPPYTVFHDKTLRAMADSLPSDFDALARIPGVGQAKLDKYGDRFLAVINGLEH